jgi:hypothetical protein
MKFEPTQGIGYNFQSFLFSKIRLCVKNVGYLDQHFTTTFRGETLSKIVIQKNNFWEKNLYFSKTIKDNTQIITPTFKMIHWGKKQLFQLFFKRNNKIIILNIVTLNFAFLHLRIFTISNSHKRFAFGF